MKSLSIDIETFSSVSLAKSGVYRYVEAPDFEIYPVISTGSITKVAKSLMPTG